MYGYFCYRIDRIIVTRHLKAAGVTSSKLGKHIEIGILTGLSTTGSKPVSGLGFAPKAIEFIIAPPTTAAAGNIYQAEGLATPQAQFGYGISQSSTSNRRFRDDFNALILQSPTGGVIFSGSVSSWDADGFTVNIAVAAGADDRVFWIAHA